MAHVETLGTVTLKKLMAPTVRDRVNGVGTWDTLSQPQRLRSTGAITLQHLGCKGIDPALRVYTGPQQARVTPS